jgi:hypothetical protein
MLVSNSWIITLFKVVWCHTCEFRTIVLWIWFAKGGLSGWLLLDWFHLRLIFLINVWTFELFLISISLSNPTILVHFAHIRSTRSVEPWNSYIFFIVWMLSCMWILFYNFVLDISCFLSFTNLFLLFNFYSGLSIIHILIVVFVELKLRSLGNILYRLLRSRILWFLIVCIRFIDRFWCPWTVSHNHKNISKS